MLTVRLQRVGRKNDPSFRMVVVDSKRGPKTGNYIEMLGSYNPRQKELSLKEDRIKHWLSVGAKTSDTVHNILVEKKVIEGKKVNPLGKKTPIVKEVEEKEETPKAETAESGEKETQPEAATEEAPKEEAKAEETPAEEKAEEPKAETKEETPAEEKPAEEKPDDAPAEAETTEAPTEEETKEAA